MKRINKHLCVLLSLLMLATLFSCDQQVDQPIDETTGREEMFPTEFVEGEYAHNPQVKKAVKLGEKTVRVEFTQPVRMLKGALGKVFYASASGESAPAKDFRMHGYSKDKDGVSYATIFEFDFDIAVSGGTISFVGERTEEHDAVMGVLAAFGGVGLYGGKEGCKVNLTEGEIPLPEEEVRMVRAIWGNQKRGQIKMVFSAPVRNLVGWNTCVFISDVSSPNPGVGGSWQYPIKDAVAVNGVKGKDGKYYATEWMVTISANASQLASIPAKGVLRISENDSGASAEYSSATDNVDCGRVVVAIDGRPLLADNIHGWDVAFAWYE